MTESVYQLSKRSSYTVHPSRLLFEPEWNGRTETQELHDHIQELSVSIAEIGVKEPLKGYKAPKNSPLIPLDENGNPQPGDWIIVTSGHCRTRAVRLAIENGHDINGVPIDLEDRLANAGDRLFTQITSNSGLQFSRLEQGKLFKKLLDYGFTKESIIKRCGCSPSHFEQCLLLTSSTPETQEAIIAGDVSATSVVQVIREVGPDEAQEVIKEAVQIAKNEGKKKATHKDVKEQIVKRFKVKEVPPTLASKETYVKFMEQTNWEAYEPDLLDKVYRLITK